MVAVHTASTSALGMLDSARRELQQSIRGLSGPQMRLPLIDGWTVKDILAHVAMWDEMELLEMRRAARGRRSLFSGRFDDSLIDRWNAVQFALRRDLPLTQVRAELNDARQAIIEFLSSVGDQQAGRGFIRTACRVQAQHDCAHAMQISEWRRGAGF